MEQESEVRAPNIEIVETKLFSSIVAEEIQASVRDAIDLAGRCSISLAGGSTPSSIYRIFARPNRENPVDWSKVYLFWGDERFVPNDHNRSNYRMVEEALLAQVVGFRPNIYAVNTALATPEDSARAYSETIQKVEKTPAGEVPQLDVVLLGIGEDGHTASLFPHSGAITDHSQLCFAVRHPEEEEFRITMSLDLLINAKRLIYLVKGENKADIVKRVLEGSESVEDLPARLFTKAKGSVTFFIDSGAATKLSRRG